MVGLTDYFVIINYDIICGIPGGRIGLVSNDWGWLWTEAMKVSIKMAVHSGRKAITTSQAQWACKSGRWHGIATRVAEHRSDTELTKDNPYLALMGELWGIY